MPTYEYRCGACGHEFEAFQSITASPKRKCPECKKNTLERLIGTGGAVIFKGGGFYQTDYRTESYKKGAEAEKKAAEGSSGKGDSKPQSNTDDKPGGKTDGKPSMKPDSKPGSKSDSKPDKKSANKAGA